MAISTGNHPKALWPGVNAWFGREYKKHDLLAPKMFDMKRSSKAYEEDVRVTGFGLAQAKAEGTSISYQDESQADTTRYTHTTYGLGYIVTEEELEDNLYEVVSKRRAGALAFSMRTTKEIVAANVLNRGFTAAYAGGDGKELFATDHPSLVGNQSNELAVAADFSEASLEDLIIQIRKAKNYRGLNIAITPQMLIVPPDLEFEAQRVLKSTLRVGTADNDINAVRSLGMLPKGFLCNPYLSDADAWFIKTDVPNGLTGFERRAMMFARDNDFGTGNALAKATERYSFGWSDWLGAFGSPGA